MWDHGAVSATCIQALKEMFPDALDEDLKAGAVLLAAQLAREFDFNREVDREILVPGLAQQLKSIFRQDEATPPQT
ncbi:hypothetical protein KNE206_25870 [Kitasatospora sp. NE20-6]|uniref:hypothetical protein n=1 Tax=Kitasatospora sp. NE20-6 TaxID=2859066 RepID=UPI0034DBF141